MGGQEVVVDVDGGALYVVPMMGRAAFENVTIMDPSGSTGSSDKVAILIGDDRQGAPLYLYIGQKGAAPSEGYVPPQFLIDNGLGYGNLYIWVADEVEGSRPLDVEDFNGTGNTLSGKFVKIEHFDPTSAGLTDFDGIGFASMKYQDDQVTALEGFRFSRPEDVATNPADGTEAVLASTGRGGAYPSDNWGTTYLVDVALEDTDLSGDLSGIDNIPATLEIVYDGDDAGAGQFSDPDYGLRSPDNLDWADDGFIYIQEDRSTSPSALFGSVSGIEASAWKLDPTTGILERILEIDRTAVPWGQIDTDPGDLGDWESSGVLDITEFIPKKGNEGTILILDTQAHAIKLGSDDLVEGGQLLLAIESTK
jgi:hypothetical protein